VKPDVIIETGVAHGGSIVFYASLCKAMEKGRVIGIDIEIRPHNRHAIEAHELFPYITLIEGDSAALAMVDQVKALINPDETVMVILDSCHTKAHVQKELECYHSLVTTDSYIVATDGIMQDLYDLDGINPDWKWDHPATAAREFALAHPEFILEQPPLVFNEGQITDYVTHWPDAWLRKI
jgi:cephalosporin hydroxylase